MYTQKTSGQYDASVAEYITGQTLTVTAEFWHTVRNELNVKHLTNYLRQWVAFQVQQHCSRLETRPELKKTMQGQRGHVGFTPPFSSLLHLLFELHPPEGSRTHRGKEQVSGAQLLRFLWAWLFDSAGGAHCSVDVSWQLPGMTLYDCEAETSVHPQRLCSVVWLRMSKNHFYNFFQHQKILCLCYELSLIFLHSTVWQWQLPSLWFLSSDG